MLEQSDQSATAPSRTAPDSADSIGAGDHAGRPDLRQEPGNRLGALGLLVAAVGAGGLAFEVPPDLLEIDAFLSWSFVALGLALLVAGLVHEWRGPKRWSALVPGLIALAFAAWAGQAGFTESASRCNRSPIVVEGMGSVGWSCHGDGPPHAVAVLVRTPWARGVPALSRGLAERGVSVYAMDPTAWVADPRGVLTGVAERARADVGGLPLGVVSWGESARELADLAEFVDADFGVAVSMLALEPIDRLGELDVPVLFAYGVDDPSYPGHGHASALVGAVGTVGVEGAVIRVFLGADRDLLVPVRRPFLQPTRLAAGWMDLLTGWIRDTSVAAE